MRLVARVVASPSLQFPRVHRVAIVVALLLAAPSLALGLFMDDYLQQAVLSGEFTAIRPLDLFRFTPADPAAMRALVELGPYPWWTAEGLRLAFWRPLSSALAVFDHAVFGRWIVLAHLHSALWYAALVGVAGLLYRRFLSDGAAALALVLFTACDAHILPVAWLPNRNALVSTVPAFLGLLAHVRHRENGWNPGRFLAPPLFATGLLGGETALGALAYLVAYELLAARGPWWERVRALVPAGLVVGAYVVTYKWLGYGAQGSGMYVDPVSSPVAFASAAPERFLVLAAGLVLKAPSDLWSLESTRPALVSVGVLAFAFLVGFLRWAWPRFDPEERVAARWLGTGAFLSSLPLLATFPSTRLLLLPSFGGLGVLALLVRRAWVDRDSRVPTPRVARLAAGYLVVMHLVFAPLSWIGMTGFVAYAGRHYERLALDMRVDDTRWATQQVILPLATDPPAFLYPTFMRWYAGGTRPKGWRVLSIATRDHRLTRTGSHVIELEVLGGSWFRETFELLFRSPEDRLQVGAQLRAGSFTATVLATDTRGPTKVSFTFDRPLEDPSLAWIAWQDGGFSTLKLPAIGESIVLGRAGVLGN